MRLTQHMLHVTCSRILTFEVTVRGTCTHARSMLFGGSVFRYPGEVIVP